MKKTITFLSLFLLLFLSNRVYPQNFWEQTDGPYGGYVFSLASNSNGHVFAGTYLHGIFRSTDNGENWTRMDNDLTMCEVESFALNSSGHIFAGTSFGIYRSTDNGAGSYGVWRSTDNGDSWTEISNGLPEYNSVLSLAVNSNGFIYAGTAGDGIYRSTDDGENWIQINNGLANTYIWSLVTNTNGQIQKFKTI